MDVCCKSSSIRTLKVFAKDRILQMWRREEDYVRTIPLDLFDKRQRTLVFKLCDVLLEIGIVGSVIEPQLKPDTNFEPSSCGMRCAVDEEPVWKYDEIWKITERQLGSR